MTDQPITESRDDESNPFAPPESVSDHFWSVDDPEIEALRRAHLQEESYVEALTITNAVYCLTCAANLAWFVWILISHLRGRVNAPWIVRPGCIAFQFVLASLAIVAFGAACGFFRRMRWALRFELLVAICLFIAWLVLPQFGVKPLPILEFITQTVWLLALASPMLNVPDLRGSIIFEPDYTHTVEATSWIKFRPNFSLEHKVIMVVLFVAAVVLGGFVVLLNPN